MYATYYAAISHIIYMAYMNASWHFRRRQSLHYFILYRASFWPQYLHL